MQHRVSAISSAVSGTEVTDLGSATNKWAAVLDDASVFVADQNAFVFNPDDGMALRIPATSLGGPFGSTIAFWWRHDTGAPSAWCCLANAT